MPGEYDRYNMKRVVSLTANIAGEDLGRVAGHVDRAIARAGEPPKGATVEVRGQIAPMNEILRGLTIGLGMAIVVILLLLTANFQSIRLALVVLSTTPAVVAGVVVALWLTGTTVNIQSFNGAIMAIGVAVANAILLVTFAERHRREGAEPARGGRGRGAGPPPADPDDELRHDRRHDPHGPWLERRGRADCPPRAGPSSAGLPRRPWRPWSCFPPSSQSSRAARAGGRPRSTPPIPRAPFTTRSSGPLPRMRVSRAMGSQRATHQHSRINPPIRQILRDPNGGHELWAAPGCRFWSGTLLRSQTMRQSIFRKLIGLAALVCLATTSSGCGQGPGVKADHSTAAAVTRVEVVQPGRATIRRSTEEPGQIEAYEVTPIYAKVSGYVQKWDVDIGAKVQKGQVLAVLSVPELDAEAEQKMATVEEAEAKLAQAKASEEVAQANLASAQAKRTEVQAGTRRADADLARWQAEFKRVEQLHTERALTGSLLDETRSKLSSAESSREEVYAQVKTAEIAVLPEPGHAGQGPLRRDGRCGEHQGRPVRHQTHTGHA